MAASISKIEGVVGRIRLWLWVIGATASPVALFITWRNWIVGHFGIVGPVAVTLNVIALGVLGALYAGRNARHKRIDLDDVDFVADVSTDPNIVYKCKIRVVLKNRSGKYLYLEKPEWVEDSAAARVQKQWYVYQKCPPSGWTASNWGDEFPAMLVEPGETFRVSFALDESLSGVRVQALHSERRLGQLVLRVKTCEYELKHPVKL